MTNLQNSMSKLGFKTINSRSSFVPHEDATAQETATWWLEQGFEIGTYREIQERRVAHFGQHPGYEAIEKAQIEYGTQVLAILEKA